MLSSSKTITSKILSRIGYELISLNDPICHFHSDEYLRINARRLEHLASLRIKVGGKTVLDVSAGIGDHSSYYLDRDCKVTLTDSRAENLHYLAGRYSQHPIMFLDMENPTPIKDAPFEIVHCYGLLYHLNSPGRALEFLATQCKGMLFLETCVSFGDAKEIYPLKENRNNPTQAFSGLGCRPTRAWVLEKLRTLFEYVYLTKTQPNHEEFPIDWTDPEKHHAFLQRAVFVASREKLENEWLTPFLLSHQMRHE
jgi:hypothetical protein